MTIYVNIYGNYRTVGGPEETLPVVREFFICASGSYRNIFEKTSRTLAGRFLLEGDRVSAF